MMTKQYQVGQRIVYPESNQILYKNKVSNIEPKAMAVLVVLLDFRGQVVSRDKLIELAWKGAIVSDSSVNRVIAQLRKVFQDTAKSPKYIETINKRGYRFKKSVEDETPQISQTNTQLKRRLAMFVALFVVVITLAWFVLQPSKPAHNFVDSVKLTNEVGTEYEPSFSRDGRYMVYSYKTEAGNYAGFHLKSLESNNTWQFPSENKAKFISPTFSTESNQIAFINVDKNHCSISQIQIDDLIANRLNPIELVSCNPELPPAMIRFGIDSNVLYLAEKQRTESPYQLNRIDIRAGTKEQLSFPANSSWGDRVFDFNHLTNQLAFVRWSPSKQQVFILDVVSKQLEEYQITDWGVKSLSWSMETDKLLLVWKKRLAILDIKTGDLVTVLTEKHIQDASMIPKNNSVAVVKSAQFSSIWTQDNANKSLHKISESDAKDSFPIYLDGENKFGFISDRSGKQQIWLSDLDGSNQRPLSSFKKPLNFTSLDWSKSERKIIAWESSNNQIWSIRLDSGHAEMIFESSQSIIYPRFSSEAKLITFGSDKSGDWDIWAVDSAGNNLQRLTFSGGYYGQLDDTSQALYYTKYFDKGVWRKQLLLNTNKLLIAEEERDDYAWWQLDKGGIYIERLSSGAPGIYRYFKDGEMAELLFPYEKKKSQLFDVSGDASAVIYGQYRAVKGGIWLYQK